MPKPPAQCRAFFVDSPQRSNEADQAGAMWISLQTGLPTLNGPAGWAPPEWDLNRSMDVPGAARRWIAQTKLQEQVCLYDRAGRRWSLFQ